MTDPVMLLSQAHGEGRVTFRALRAAGFYTLAAVAEAQIQVLADRAHLSTRTARRLKAGAEEMVGQGIGRDFPGPGNGPRAARGRGPRSSRRSNGTLSFSDGLTLEEALMLGQGAVAPPAAPESPSTPRPAPSDDPGHPLAVPAAAVEQLSESLIVSMAAAAQAAAALPRVSRATPNRDSAAPPPSATGEPAQPSARDDEEKHAPPTRDDGPVSWSFG